MSKETKKIMSKEELKKFVKMLDKNFVESCFEEDNIEKLAPLIKCLIDAGFDNEWIENDFFFEIFKYGKAGFDKLIKKEKELVNNQNFKQVELNDEFKNFMNLKNKQAIMSDEEMIQFIKNIGRCELYDELKKAEKGEEDYAYLYLKAVRVVLNTLGYSQDWVEFKFRDTLQNYYYK